MILVGQYDSPFVRRVAISLMTLGVQFDRDTRSVFGDFAAMRAVNPLGRIPSLILDDGEVLIDSGAILDWLDQLVGPERALTPASGDARRKAMQVTALAAGAIEKFGAVAYELIIRPAARRWPEWIERCRTQGIGALEALDRVDWCDGARLDQMQITTGCLVGYLKLALPEMIPQGRFARLDALWTRCDARPEFAATRVTDYAVPRGA